MENTKSIVERAWRLGVAVPAFNVPYLEMVRPIIRAVIDQDAFALVEVARIEWQKFGCIGPAEVMEEFTRYADISFVRLHLDHTPVLDEETGEPVDYLPILEQALCLGFHSVMVDGSALPFEENAAATRRAVELAHKAGVPCEAELGAIVREGEGNPLSYEELFASGRGFTDPADAARFVAETGCDWLSVAAGNIHGAVSGALKDKNKTVARLNHAHLERLRDAAGVPLVLHGGSGIGRDDLAGAVRRGITKVNVAFELRRAYETGLRNSGGDITAAQDAVYRCACDLIVHRFGVAHSRSRLTEPA
jgi:fructose-bisphosphate aldolase, class II